MTIAWLATENGFQKATLLEVGKGFRKIKIIEGPRDGEEITLPPEGMSYQGFHPCLYIQDKEPNVWTFKGRSIPYVSHSDFSNPKQAKALHDGNAEIENGKIKTYIFQPHTQQVIDGVIKGDHQFLIGHKGVGKTSVILQVAAAIGQPVIRLNFTGQISISDLVGCTSFGKEGTVWNDGPVITAMRNGYWLLLDEFDFGDPSVLSIFHPILEKRPSYCLKENNGEVVIAHPSFRVFATGNSIGGDKDGQYAGTQQLNAALLDRFAGHGQVIEVKPMTYKQEREVLVKVLPDLPYRLAKKATIFAAKIRAEHLRSFSTRELLNWCQKMMLYKDAVAAAKLTFLPIIENENTRKGVEEAIKAIFGNRIIIGRYMIPASGIVGATPKAKKAAPVSTGTRSSADITDPKEIEEIAKSYKKNGGTLGYAEIEAQFNLKSNKGMNAYRVCKKYKAMKASSKSETGEVAVEVTAEPTTDEAAVATAEVE